MEEHRGRQRIRWRPRFFLFASQKRLSSVALSSRAYRRVGRRPSPSFVDRAARSRTRRELGLRSLSRDSFFFWF
jgi:hypothetical protein